MAIQLQKPAYVSESKRFMKVVNKITRLFWALMAFVYVEITCFGDNFVEKNLIVMRMLLVFTVITFLIIIIPMVLENPPIPIDKIVVMIVLPCAACVLLVLMISTVTAVIVFIIWIIFYFVVVRSSTQQEPTTYVRDLKSFKYVSDMIFKLFYALIVLVAVEITNFGDNMVEKNLFAMRFVLVLAVFTFLIVIIPDILENPPVRILQTMVLMVMSCVVCVLLVLFISTVTAVIVFIFWSVGIFTVAVERWDDLVHQIKAIF